MSLYCFSFAKVKKKLLILIKEINREIQRLEQQNK